MVHCAMRWRAGNRITAKAPLKSALHLPRGLIDQHLDRHALRAAAAPRAAHRGGAEIIEPDRHADVSIRGANPIRRIERNPADRWDIGLGPGMAGILLHDAIGAVEIPADIAGWNIKITRSRDENVSEILADATLEHESLSGGRGRMRRVRIVFHLAVDAAEQRVQDSERIIRSAAGLTREIRDRKVRLRKRGRAQIKTWREALDRPAHDAARVLHVDLALDFHAKFGKRAFRRKGVRDVAESVLMLVETAVLADVDTPTNDIVAVVIARRKT